MSNWNKNAGYGRGLVDFVRTIVPTFGNILVVMNSSNSDEANYHHMQEVMTPDPDGLVRFYTTLDAAYAAAESNNNDVILLDANSSHNVAVGGLAVSKSRVHFIGMDGGGRYIQQGAKVQSTAGTAAVYVIKNTGTRNSFRNIKFIQTDDEATSLTVFQEGGEGTYFENCSFTFGVADNLDQTNAYDFVHGGDSVTMKECTFGNDTLLTSAGRAVMAIDQVTSGQPFKNNIFKDCLWMTSTSSTDLSFIRVLATTDVLFGNVFINPIMMNAIVTSTSAAATDDAVDSVASLVEGNILFVNPNHNATAFCSDVTDHIQVCGPLTHVNAGAPQTPA